MESVAVQHARAAIDSVTGLTFEVGFDDATVTGSVTPEGKVTINAHPCSVAGGMVGALFAKASVGGCPHGAAVAGPLADLAGECGWEDDVVAAVRSGAVETNPGKAVKLGRLEWSYDGGAWVRGLDLLKPQVLRFPPIADLVKEGLYSPPDPTYVANKKLFARLDAIAGSPIYESVLLVGPSGHGKSEGARQWCAQRNRPYWEITLGVDARVEGVVGGVGLENGSTVRRDGLVSILAHPGGTLILNELTSVNQREWTPLWPLLEKGASVVRTEVEGRRYALPVHPTAMIIATANEAKGMHAEANGGQGFAQLRRLTEVEVSMTPAEVEKVAKVIAKARLAPTTIDIGGGQTYVVPDRTGVFDLLDFSRFARLASYLMNSAEVNEVLEVSPEILACAVLDAANPVIGVTESLMSHFVLKAGTTWGQEVVAREIAASALFPEVTNSGAFRKFT